MRKYALLAVGTGAVLLCAAGLSSNGVSDEFQEAGKTNP